MVEAIIGHDVGENVTGVREGGPNVGGGDLAAEVGAGNVPVDEDLAGTADNRVGGMSEAVSGLTASVGEGPEEEESVLISIASQHVLHNTNMDEFGIPPLPAQ